MCAASLLSRAADAEGAEKAAEATVEKAVQEWQSRGEPVPEALSLLKEVNAAARASAKGMLGGGVAGKLLGMRSRLFESACARATPEELRLLGAMIPELPMAGPLWFDADVRLDECVIAYGNAVFQHEVKKLKAKPVNLKLAPSEAAPPPHLEIWPKGLRDAWLAWRGAANALEEEKEMGAFGESTLGTVQTSGTPGVRDALLFQKLGPKPEPGLWRQLLAQEQRKGLRIKREEESTRRARHRAILVSLLADGRLREAVGVVCNQLAREEGYPNDRARNSYATLAREFLTGVGLDWEMIFTGFLLAERTQNPGVFNPGVLGNTEAWLILGAHGSPHGVQLGLDWIAHAKMRSEDARPFLLRALGPEPQNPVTANDPRPKRTEALPAEVRAKAVALLSEFLDPGQPDGLLGRSVEDLTPALAKDFERPLKALLTHRTHVIAARALWLLRSAGLVGPEVQIAPPKALARVRLIVDGAPLANTSVTVQLKHTQQRFTTLSQQRLTTSADGELVIPQSAVSQREKVESVVLSLVPEVERLAGAPSRQPNEGGTQVAEGPPAILSKPWFAIAVPIQEENTIQEIAIRTAELEIGLKRNPGVGADEEMSVSLVRTGMSPDRMIRAKGKPGESVVFPRVQLGSYRMVITGNSIVLPAPQEVHVTKMGSLKLVDLQAGRNVRAAVGGASSPNARISSIAKLWRDGLELKATRHARGNGWDGLPLGKYRLRVASSTELEQLMRGRGMVGILPSNTAQRHAAREVEFELKPESPSIVDLGVIQLEPEAAKQEK